MKTNQHLLSRSLSTGLILAALGGSATAQVINAPNGVNLNGTGRIQNGPHITFPDSVTPTGTSWEFTPALQGFLVPAAQLTGLATDGSFVSYEDLIPIKTSKLTVVTGAPGAPPTGSGTIIDGDGVETNGLSLLDSGSSSSVPITIENGQLFVGGNPVGTPPATINQVLAPVTDNGALVPIPGGTLTTLAGEPASIPIAAFQIGRTEVTFGEYLDTYAWAIQNGYGFTATAPSAGGISFTMAVDHSVSPVRATFIQLGGNPSAAGGYSQGGFDRPVLGINWFDAVKWCNANSQLRGFDPVYYIDSNNDGVYDAGDTLYQTGEPASTGGSGPIVRNPAANGYRLPTEAEWEWAARGGNMDPDIYAWGTTIISGEYANLGGRRYSVVGSFPRGVNPYGLHDMTGNAMEHCFDWDPNNVGVGRIRRGGGTWTVSQRGGYGPNTRSIINGFRVARNN